MKNAWKIDLFGKLPPALPYDHNVLLGLTSYLTYAPLQHTMESFKQELSNELKLFLRFTDGRALGLFTARERMEFVAGQISNDLSRSGIPLYVQSPDTSRRRLLEAFRERKEAVLFGLRSFWEGVDVPGETLSFVLMEKLPFPLLIEPVHRARAGYLTKQGKSEFDDYMLPLMLLQLSKGLDGCCAEKTIAARLCCLTVVFIASTTKPICLTLCPVFCHAMKMLNAHGGGFMKSWLPHFRI